MSTANYRPEGTPAVIPHIITTDSKELLAFCQKVFEAVPGMMMPGPDGKGVMHGAMTIAGSPIYFSDVMGHGKPTQANTMVYVPDVDAVFKRATEAGATVIMPLADMFWGDRWAMVQDPFGNHWQMATHKKQISPEDASKAMKEEMEAARAAKR